MLNGIGISDPEGNLYYLCSNASLISGTMKGCQIFSRREWKVLLAKISNGEEYFGKMM